MIDFIVGLSIGIVYGISLSIYINKRRKEKNGRRAAG